MKSSDLSKKLAAVGEAISPETIRGDWAHGAPRSSAASYLKWRQARAKRTGRGDPMLRKLKADKLRGEICILADRHKAEEREHRQKAGELISRAWIAQRISIAAGKVDSLRLKSEAEDPLKFAAAAGDVAACRAVVHGVWDGIAASLHALREDFREPNQTSP